MSAPAPARLPGTRPAPGPAPGPRRSSPAGRDRLVVAPPPRPRRTSARRAPFVVFVLGLLIAGLMGLLAINTAASEDAFTLRDLRQTSADLAIEQQRLAEQLARAQAPGPLAARARELGMVPAERSKFLRLPPPPQPAQPSSTQSGQGR